MLKHAVLGDLPAFKADPLGTVETATLGDRPVAQLRLAHRTIYASSDPEVFRSVLIDDADSWGKGSEVDSMRPVLGDGLVTAQGASWHAGREALTKAFKPQHLCDGLDTAADRLLYQVASCAARSEAVDLRAFTGRATLAMVAQALFGVTLSDARLETLPEAVGEGHAVLSQRLSGLITLPQGVPTPGNRRLRRVTRELYAAAADLRDQMPDNTLRRGIEQLEATGGRQAALEQIVTLLVAGFETSASTAAWMLYTVAQKPDLLTRLRRACDHSERTPATIGQEPLVAAVVKETLRLYPSTWWFARTARRDVRFGDVTVPAGASLLLVPWSLHRRPDLWSDPESFDPDRWMDSRAQPDRWSWMPFGAGARACIGRNLALANLGQLLWVTATAFDIEALSGPVSEMKPFAGITLGPPKDTPLQVRFHARPARPGSGEAATRSARIQPTTVERLRVQLESVHEDASRMNGTGEVQYFIRVALQALVDVEREHLGERVPRNWREAAQESSEDTGTLVN